MSRLCAAIAVLCAVKCIVVNGANKDLIDAIKAANFSVPPSIAGQVDGDVCPNTDSEYRLPKKVLPVNYKLKLWPQLGIR